jgi:antitoxin HicB
MGTRAIHSAPARRDMRCAPRFEVEDKGLDPEASGSLLRSEIRDWSGEMRVAVARFVRFIDYACRHWENWHMRYRITIEPDEDGVFVAECPALPGCISQGDTREAAIANIRDAIRGYVVSLEKHGEPVPLPITEEIIEV